MPFEMAVPAPVASARAGISGSDQLFPVRRIYCVGRNYAEHAREMGHDPTREAPFFFQKPTDAFDQSGRFPYPPGSSEVQHEVELVVSAEQLPAMREDVEAVVEVIVRGAVHLNAHRAGQQDFVVARK